MENSGFSRAEAQNSKPFNSFNKLTMGVVLDNDDPLGQGRVRVSCSALGDYEDKPISEIPWALVMSPFLGATLSRESHEDGISSGPMSHGFWCTPQIGATAIVACVDNNINVRVCLGFLPLDFLMNTFPNGKYRVDDNEIMGPKTADGYPYSPTFMNHMEAFGEPSTSNYEWFTRAFEQQAVILSEDNLDISYDDEGDIDQYNLIMDNGQVYRVSHGHKDNPGLPGIGKRTNTVYGWVSPRGHSMLMNDADDNMRMKFRTVKGSQILLDDTNERIYINTAQGNNWIEMDFDGNVDVYSKASVSIRAAKNLNLTADNLVNIYGGNGVHVTTKGEFRTHSDNDTHMTTDTHMRVKVSGSKFEEITADSHYLVTGSMFSKCVNFNLNASGDFNLSDANTNIKSQTQVAIQGSTVGVKGDTSVNIDGGASVGIKGGSDVTASAGAIYLNTSPAPAAPTPGSPTDPSVSNAQLAFWTNRTPDHEPWPRRSFVDGNTNHTSYKFPNNNDLRIGLEDVENLLNRERNPFWRR